MTADQLTLQDFADLEPGSIVLRLHGSDLPLTVAQLRDLPAGPPRAKPFAVTLEGPADPLLPQGIYPLVHPTLGEFELFIVPVGRDARRCVYELTFN